MSVSRSIGYQALRSTYQPSSCYLAARNRHYSASAAAEQPSEEAGPSSSGLSSSQSESTPPSSTGEQSTRKAKSFRPISNKNRMAYERAKSNAEALRKSILQGDASKVTPENSLSGPVASSSALTPSKPKIEQSPTLETLESYRPERPPNPFGQRYKARYDKVWWAVSTAFLRKQLLKLAREIGFKGSNRVTTKDSLVEYILRTWDWPPVAEVEAEKKAIEEARKPVERVIPLSHMEMFVLLRKSPRVLTDIADRQNITITMSQAPELGLRAKGLAVHLGHLETVLEDMKKTIVHEYTSAEDIGAVEKRWLPAVAEMTGAFIEAMPNNMYMIFSTGGRQAGAAKRLLRSAWIKNVHFAQKRPLLSTVPGFATPKPLAMYPFMPVPTSVLEWDAPHQPLFRVRTVGSWFAAQRASPELGEVDAVKSNDPIVEKKLAELLSQPAEGPSQATRRLNAKIGHVLHASRESAGTLSLLTPPLQGQWRLDALRQWSPEGTTIFAAGLPPTFSQNSPPSLATATKSRRLLYREVGTNKFFALEITYPKAPAPEPSPPKADWAAELDMLLEGLDEPAEPEPQPLQSSDLDVSSRYGVVSELDLMMPDRGNDVRIAVEDAVNLDLNSPPPQFEAFISELAAQNETHRLIVPPPTLNLQLHGKVSYELVEDIEVERVQQGSSMWWMSKRDILANGLEGAPELVIEQSQADPDALLKTIAETTSLAYGPPAATNWSMPGSHI